MRVATIFLVLSALLSACATAPNDIEVAQADIGPVPKNPQKLVKDYFGTALFDPYSAVFTFNYGPVRGFAGDRIQGAKIGWKVCGTVNAKNRFGAYVGAKPFRVIILRDTVVYHDLDAPWSTLC